MTEREQKAEQVRLLSDADINDKIIDFCFEHDFVVKFSMFTKSLNAMRALEDHGFSLYRWQEKYEDWLDDIKDPKTPIWNVPPRHKAEAFILSVNLI